MLLNTCSLVRNAAIMSQVHAFYWSYWRRLSSNFLKVCELVSWEVYFSFPFLINFFQHHTSTISSVTTATPRVTVREEEAILKEDTQTETSSPVCSHNEWDPLEVKVKEKSCILAYHTVASFPGSSVSSPAQEPGKPG